MLILASQSQIRLSLLEAAGVTVIAKRSPLHEEEFQHQHQHLDAKALATALATAKAQATSVHQPGDIVIGCDQTLEHNGKTLHKAKNISEARQHLLALRNSTHHLHAAFSIAQNNQTLVTHTETASLTMRNFSAAFLDDYLSLHGHKILNSVGCYHLEAEGIQLFDHIAGDYFTILGLPLLPLLENLRKLGMLQQ